MYNVDVVKRMVDAVADMLITEETLVIQLGTLRATMHGSFLLFPQK